MKKIISMMLALVLVLSLTACSGSDKNTGNMGSTGENNTGSEKTIYVIVKVLGTQYWSVVQAGAEKAGTEIKYADVGDTYSFGNGEFQIVGPVTPGKDLNNDSIVIHYQYGDTSFLFTGDAGSGQSEIRRYLIENDWLDDLKYICKPTEYHEKRITVHFVCDRGVSHKEFVA